MEHRAAGEGGGGGGGGGGVLCECEVEGDRGGGEEVERWPAGAELSERKQEDHQAGPQLRPDLLTHQSNNQGIKVVFSQSTLYLFPAWPDHGPASVQTRA